MFEQRDGFHSLTDTARGGPESSIRPNTKESPWLGQAIE